MTSKQVLNGHDCHKGESAIGLLLTCCLILQNSVWRQLALKANFLLNSTNHPLQATTHTTEASTMRSQFSQQQRQLNFG